MSFPGAFKLFPLEINSVYRQLAKLMYNLNQNVYYWQVGGPSKISLCLSIPDILHISW